jgi:hypothetical protein
MDLVLTPGQFQLVYNSFSFVVAAMLAAGLFFLLGRSQISGRHRPAVTLSTASFGNSVSGRTVGGGSVVVDGWIGIDGVVERSARSSVTKIQSSVNMISEALMKMLWSGGRRQGRRLAR